MSNKFGISWIYEEFQINRFQSGKLIDSWSSPTPVTNTEEFDQAIKASKDIVNIRRGGQVSIVFESSVHTHSFIELPPMSDRDLKHYLERRVVQEKSFSEEAAWSYSRTSHTTKGKGVLLHLMPDNILQDIIKVCESNRLEPRKVVPLTDVMGQHTSGLPTENESIIFLIALFEKHVEIVIADGKGKSYFVRELGFHWREDNIERLKLDIERTLLYTKQQFGIADHVWIMGEESEAAALELNNHFDVEIESDPSSIEAGFWAKEVVSLSNKLSSNFVPDSLQATFTRRTVIRFGVATAAASLFMAVGSTLIVHSMKLGSNADIQNEISHLERKKKDLEEQFSDLKLKKEYLDAITFTPEPVPAWFLSYLSEAVPNGMILSKANISKQEGKWKFSLKGATNPTLANSALTIEVLESALNTPPWNADISQNWRQDWLEKLRSGKAGEDGLISFNIEGQM